MTSFGSFQTTKSFAGPSPASPAASQSTTSLPLAGTASFTRDSCCAASGVTGSIHAFGPPTFPMCPTLLNFHSVFCHSPISATIAGTFSGLAVRQRARSPSSNGDGSLALRNLTSEPRYFALRPRSRATASALFAASRTSSDAARYLSSGRLPPLFLSSAMPCCVTVSTPPTAVKPL